MADNSALDWPRAQANQPNEPFDPIGNLKRNVQGALSTVAAVPGNIQRLVTDPSEYIKNLPAPTMEQMAGAFNPSHVASGMAGVMKPKGGNWFKDTIANDLRSIRQRTTVGSDPAETLAEMNQKWTPEAIEEVAQTVPHVREMIPRQKADLKNQVSLNKWIDKNLTNYIKNQMATPEDPVRLMIEKRVELANNKYAKDIAKADRIKQRALEEADPRRQANFQREADRIKSEAEFERDLNLQHASHLPDQEFNQEDISELKNDREREGMPTKSYAKYPQSENWENFSDISIFPKKANVIQTANKNYDLFKQADEDLKNASQQLDQKLSNHIKEKLPHISDEQLNKIVRGMTFDEKESMVGDDSYTKAWAKRENLNQPAIKYNARIAKENPDLLKIDPDTSVYSSTTYKLGFDHVLDILKNDLQTGRITPEQLNNISVEDAIARTADVNKEAARKMQDAQAKRLEDMTVHKEYPNGMKWVQLDKPGQFSAESQAMGHSVKGYEPPVNHPDWIPESSDFGSLNYGHGGWEGIKSGRAKIYSLVDPKGNPHVTIESKAPQIRSNYDEMSNIQRQADQEANEQNFDNFALRDQFTEARIKELKDQLYKSKIPEGQYSITQVKGKLNQKPNEQYLPYVQDFVKSGNWAEVGDLHNTGLNKVGDQYLTTEELKPKVDEAKTFLDTHPAFETHRQADSNPNQLLHPDVPYALNEMKAVLNNPEEYDKDTLPSALNGVEKLRGIYGDAPQPPIDLGTVGGTPNMKKGGKVSITNNPDAMYMEVQDRKFADGGQVTQSPSDWLKSLANAPSQEFHPIDTLTQNLQGLANLPSKAYEGAKQLVTDPQAYFSNIKAPTPEEMAMAFNPAGLETGMMGMTKAVKPSLLSNEMKVLPNDVSTRVPTAVKATEDPLKSTLLSDYPTMKKDPEALEHNLGLIKTYPNFVSKSRSVNGQMEDFINNTKDNLLFLHDMVPADTRERSKLWYDGAHNIVDRFGNEYGTPEHASAGVLAVLSPQKDWFMNVSLGDRVHDIWKNQGDYKWDKDMTGTANEIFNKPQYAPMLKAIKGKAFNELTDPTEKAMWLRTFDQTYNPREHQIVTPEGDFSGVRLTDKGQPYKTGWGSLNEIGKAIDILDNPSKENISANLGGQHKVRNFYNNIYFPNNPDPHVTIDTHAVAAGLLRPLSGNSREVSHNFGSNALGEVGPKNSAFTGLQGTYPAYAEAYKRAAEERGLLPRQMQSITWEAVRGLFPDTFKNATNNAEINNIWDLYKRKKITIDDARQKILEKAGGINEPEWKQ